MYIENSYEYVKTTDEDLEDIGFFKTIEFVCKFARSSVAKQILKNLRPLKESVVYKRELDLILEMASLRTSTQGFYLPEFSDMNEILKCLKSKTPLLEPESLMQIAINLRATGYIRKIALDLDDEYLLLKSLFNSVTGQTDLLSAIEWAIGPENEVLSRASSELKRIRKETDHYRQKVRNTLKGFMSKNSSHIQDDIISSRSFRFVVLLKSGSMSKVNGLVHDQSGSGKAVYFEPIESVDLNNRLSDLFNQEKREIVKVLSELTLKAASQREGLERDYNCLGLIDALVAKADFHRKFNCSFPIIEQASTIKIMKARHPLLGKSACPVDILLPDDIKFLLISGPNAGGKSVTLKMCGLFSMMLQSGITAPVSPDSTFPVFEQMFTDMGDKQSIEDSLSTFSSHIVTLNKILRNADSKSLVLIDEICDGTDPQEGTALAMAMMKELNKSGALCVITSHYGPLKVFAMQESGAINAAMTFDKKTLRPKYSLKMGLPGKSYGIDLAVRYGIPEHVLDDAKAYLGEDIIKVEDLLEKLDLQITQTAQSLSRAKASENRAENVRKKYEKLFKLLKTREEKKIYDLYEKVKQELDQEKSKITHLIKKSDTTVKESDTPRAVSEQKDTHNGSTDRPFNSFPGKKNKIATIDNKTGAKALGAVKEFRKKLVKARKELGKTTAPKELGPGVVVRIKSLMMNAEILEIRKQNNKVCVQAGSLKIDVSLDDIMLPGDQDINIIEEIETRPVESSANKFDKKKKGKKKKGILQSLEKHENLDKKVSTTSIRPEIDIRGEYPDVAVNILDSYLYRASNVGIKNVRIIHGKGTGRLRAAVAEYLHKLPIVKDFRLAEYNDGGTGATIVDFY